MLKHYFRLLFKKQPVFTAINFTGLVMGIAAFLLLFKYVSYEYTYDRQTPHYENIWRVFNQTMVGNTVTTQDANTHSALGPILKAEVPGVVDFARLYCGNSPEIVVLVDNKSHEIKKFFATDQSFFRMFPQKVLRGNIQNCLDKPYTTVITKSKALAMYANENAVGKHLKINTGMLTGDYIVTAVIDDVPQNTHLKFDMLVSYKTRYAQGHVDNLESYWDYNYIQLAPGTSPQKVRDRLETINKKLIKESGIQLEIQPFKDIHLRSNLTYELEPNGSYRIVNFLGMVAILILIIAFINYINLSAALANERNKEIGVRKILGASKITLIMQFLIESFLLSGFAFIISYFLVYLALPAFGDFVGKDFVNMQDDFDLKFWVLSISIVLIISLLTGLIPALQLSGFVPSQVLKGTYTLGNVSIVRKGLVVFQFACSIVLIIGVLVISGQLRYMQNHDMGIKLDQMITLKTNIFSQGDTLAAQKLGFLKEKLKALPEVVLTASSSIVPGQGINTISGSSRPIHWTQSDKYANVTSYYVNTDEDFYKLFGVKILAGQPKFYPDRESRFRHVMINKSMLEALGFSSPQSAIGQSIAYENSENNFSMVVDGVIEDFHIESLKTAPNPTLYYCFAPEQLNYLSIKLNQNDIKQSLGKIEEIWKTTFPQHPFDYTFLDQIFMAQYKSEQQFGKVFGLFSLLAIFISSLGLLGLVSFNVQKRTKEIGIRKVLGAAVPDLIVLVSKDFLILVLIAIVIASPLAYLIMQNWLKDYVYRISLSASYFVFAGLIALLISFLTLSYQVIKVTFINPVKSLKVD